MWKSLLFLIVLVPICFAGWANAQEQTQSQPMAVGDLELTKSLSEKLGVKPEQAAGAAGAIFGLAKSKLSAEDFAKVSGAVPGMDLLLNAAPVLDAGTTGLTQLAGASGLASLAGSFQKLGLSPDMVGKFVPEILSYVNTKGGSAVSALLGNVLK